MTHPLSEEDVEKLKIICKAHSIGELSIGTLKQLISEWREMKIQVKNFHECEWHKLAERHNRYRAALERILPHAQIMQNRYKAEEDRIQAAEDIRIAKKALWG